LATWTQLADQAPFAARAAGSLQYQEATGKVFYMAGSDGLLPPAGFGTTLFNDVWVSNDEGKTWELATADAGWAAREGFTGQSSGNDVVVAGESLVIMGGEQGYFPTGFFGDIWSSKDGVEWVQRREKTEWTGFSSESLWNLKGRSGHIVTSQKKEDGSSVFWLSGGYLGMSDVWCLNVRSVDDLSNPWTRVAKTSPWHGRFDHMMVVVGNKLVLFAGENSAAGFGGPYFNDVWAADLEDCPVAEDALQV
jgi:hypothetical protein